MFSARSKAPQAHTAVGYSSKGARGQVDTEKSRILGNGKLTASAVVSA